jgi:hypothetical protein
MLPRLFLSFMMFSAFSKVSLFRFDLKIFDLTQCYYSVNTQQFCDILAKNCGWKVVMPDFFRGESIPKECMGNRPALIEWITKVGSYDIVSWIEEGIFGETNELNP